MTKGCWRNITRRFLVAARWRKTLLPIRAHCRYHASSIRVLATAKVEKTLSFLLIDFRPADANWAAFFSQYVCCACFGRPPPDLVRRDLTNWYGLCTNLFLTSSWFICKIVYMHLRHWYCWNHDQTRTARSRSQNNKDIPNGSRKYSKIKNNFN